MNRSAVVMLLAVAGWMAAPAEAADLPLPPEPAPVEARPAVLQDSLEVQPASGIVAGAAVPAVAAPVPVAFPGYFAAYAAWPYVYSAYPTFAWGGFYPYVPYVYYPYAFYYPYGWPFAYYAPYAHLAAWPVGVYSPYVWPYY